MDFLAGAGTYILSFLVVLTGIVFVHEWGHYIAARICGVRVETFSIGFGPELFGRNARSGTRWKVSAIPLGGYVKFYGDAGAASTPGETVDRMTAEERRVSFHHKPVGQRMFIVAAGPLANFIFAILIYAGLFAFNGQPYTAPVVGEVVAGSAADTAGFRAQDRVLSIDGRKIERFEDIRAAIVLATGNELDVKVLRQGEVVALTVVPRRVEVPDGFGGVARIGQIGVRSAGAVELVRHGPLTALWAGVRETGQVVNSTLTYLGRVIRGAESGEDLGGPLRIAKMSGDVAQFGIGGLILLTAMLSVSIGLVNLFPVPLLDGGHLVYYAVEALRGRPLGERAQEMGFRFGLAVVLAVFVFATWNDLVHLKVIPFISGLFS